MAKITLHGNEFNTIANLPAIGSVAHELNLTKADLGEISLKDVAGKKVVLNIFPSLDTATCAASVRNFNKEAASLDNTIVICISMDLPFAMSRFCSTEGLNNVVTASGFRNHEFGKKYGVEIVDGPLRGLYARSVVILNEKGEVKYTELVAEIADEPNYKAAIAAL
ncbi:MAG: thiol peroxidase [Bacteroidales bacterium]